MRLRLKQDQVLIRKDVLDTDERGRIRTPAGLSIRPDAVWSGTVVAVGPGRRSKTGVLIPCESHPGDHVYCEHLRGMEVNVPGHGPHLFIRDKFVLFAT